MTRTSPQLGFSLIEVVVALAVLAVILGTVLRMLGGTAGSADVAQNQLRALTIAQSQLAEFGSLSGIQPGARNGIVDDGDWQVSVTPFAAPHPTPQSLIYHITVIATYRGSRVTLETLRIAAAQP